MKLKLHLLLRVFISFILMSLYTNSVFAQNKTITGTVKDQGGTALSGATINVKGTDIATTSDSAGNFRVTVPEKTKAISISFVGMENQDVDIAGTTQVDASLKFSNTNLDNVVVVGYGTQTRATVTAAITKVDGKNISNQPVSTPAEALAGLAA